MPTTIGKCNLFKIKHTTLLEGETSLGNKHKIEFYKIKCTIFGRKENTIRWNLVVVYRNIHVVCFTGYVEVQSIEHNHIYQVGTDAVGARIFLTNENRWVKTYA